MSGMGGCTRKQISRQHSSRGFWDMQAHWLRNVGDPATSGWHTIDSKKIYRIIQTNTNCGKTATTCSLGPDSTLGEKGEKINLASEGSRAVVWGWERVGEPGDTPYMRPICPPANKLSFKYQHIKFSSRMSACVYCFTFWKNIWIRRDEVRVQRDLLNFDCQLLWRGEIRLK